jgi:Uma2 family endonuclease
VNFLSLGYYERRHQFSEIKESPMYEMLLEPETEEISEEVEEMGSWNHSIIQANVTFSLKRTGEYRVLISLSLDASQLDAERFNFQDELVPDVCVYPKDRFSTVSRPYDILKMIEMPMTVIEILSPIQSNYEFLNKFEAYFTLGVKSCWLIDPVLAVVGVYRSLTENNPPQATAVLILTGQATVDRRVWAVRL